MGYTLVYSFAWVWRNSDADIIFWYVRACVRKKSKAGSEDEANVTKGGTWGGSERPGGVWGEGGGEFTP